MPAVTLLGVYPCVAALAESHEIIPVVRPALGERELVVYLLGRRINTVLQALLAQRVGGGVAVTDTFPRPTVPLAHRWVTVVPLVAFILQPLMLLAVTLTVLHQIGTARKGTWVLRLSWHMLHLPCKAKAPEGMLPSRHCLCSAFHAISITGPIAKCVRRITHTLLA